MKLAKLERLKGVGIKRWTFLQMQFDKGMMHGATKQTLGFRQFVTSYNQIDHAAASRLPVAASQGPHAH
jgi:hypothetical protein